MKKIFFASALTALLCAPTLAKDVEVIELESISEPAVSDEFATPAPTSADIAAARLEAERLVQEAYYVVREFENNEEYSEEVKLRLSQARAILVFPDVLKAGWVFGVSGGKGVLLARSKTGVWSYPAFYSITDASIGVQFGINSSRVLMVINSGKGLGAIIDNEFKAGASVSAAVANQGSSIGYGTTTNLRQDIYTYATSKGAFIGASIDVSAIEANNLMNEVYYGSKDATTQSIILDGQYANRSADIFREALSKYKYEHIYE